MSFVFESLMGKLCQRRKYAVFFVTKNPLIIKLNGVILLLSRTTLLLKAMAITQNSSEGLISVSGDVLPGTYSYIIVGSEYGEWAYFRPDGSSDYYLIGDGQYVDESSPPPVLAVGVGDAPGRDLTYGTLDIRGSEGAPIVVDVRGFTGFPQTEGAPIALFIIGDSGGQGNVYASHAIINVNSQIDGQGIENLGNDRSVVIIGDHGYGDLNLSSSEMRVDAGYQASVHLGGQSASDQGSADFDLYSSELIVEAHRASLAIGGGDHTNLRLSNSDIVVRSDPRPEYVNATDGWIDATIKVGVGDGLGQLFAYAGSTILVEGKHAGIEVGIDGTNAYGYARLNTTVEVVATGGNNEWIRGTEGAPQENFAYVNVGGRPWVKSDRDGDGPGGVGVLHLQSGALLNVRAESDPAETNASQSHSELNIGTTGGTGFVVMGSDSVLNVETINVGDSNHTSPYEPGYGLFYTNYNAVVNADSMVVGDRSGLATHEHAYLRIEGAGPVYFNVGTVDVTHGGVLLGPGFRLSNTVTIDEGGVFRIGDEYESSTDFWSLGYGQRQEITGEVVDGWGYFGNDGLLQIDGTVVMQASSAESNWYGSRDHIYNDGVLIIGDTARFEVTLEADASYYVQASAYTNDPALYATSVNWGRVLLADGTGTINLDAAAAVKVNGVEGDLWLDDGRLWAYFDLNTAFGERGHWVIENQSGVPIAISLENPIDADLLSGEAGYNYKTIEDAPYSAISRVYDNGGNGVIQGTAADEVLLIPADFGYSGERTFATGGGNDLVFADGIFEDLMNQDGDVLTFSGLSQNLDWNFNHGSVTNNNWTTLFTGIEVVVGGSADDTYRLNGGDAVTIADHFGNNQYTLSPSFMALTEPNWAIDYAHDFGANLGVPAADFYIDGAVTDGRMIINRKDADTDALLGEDSIDGVAILTDSRGDDVLDFRGFEQTAYSRQFGDVAFNLVGLAGGGQDVITGSGDTIVDFLWGSNVINGQSIRDISFNAADAQLNADGLFEYTVDWAGGRTRLINVDAVGGTFGADLFYGSDRDETFRDRGGDDTIYGGYGTDVLDYRAMKDNSNASIRLQDETLGVTSWATGGIGSDTLSGVEIVRTSTYDDYFFATDFKYFDADGYIRTFNAFRGRGGDDQIWGNGNTRVEYVDALVAVHVDLEEGFSDARFESDLETQAYIDSLGKDRIYFGVNAVHGSAFDDWIVGSRENDAEFFQGRAGSDLIDGGGGAWNHVMHDADIDAVYVDLKAGIAHDGWGGTDTLIDIQGVTGSAYADTLIGTDLLRQEGFDGGGGADIILAGGGYDEVMYASAQQGVTVDLSAAQVTREIDGTTYSGLLISDGTGSVDFVSGVEGVEGSRFDDVITGDGGNNRIDGREGSDTLDGGGGEDWVEYSRNAGDDNLNGVVVSLAEGTALQGIDRYGFDINSSTVSGSNWTGDRDTLSNFENVQGSAGDDLLIGDGADNKFSTGGGDDHIVGGAGIDTFIIDGYRENTWWQYDGFVEGRVFVTGNFGKAVLDGVERLQFSDGEVVDLKIFNAPTIDLNGPDRTGIVLDNGFGPFMHWGGNGSEPRPYSAPSLVDWGSGSLSLPGGVQAVRFTLEEVGTRNNTPFKVAYQRWDNDSQEDVDVETLDLFSTASFSVSHALQSTDDLLDGPNAWINSLDQSFTVSLEPQVVNGKTVQTITVATTDSRTISGEGFVEFLRHLRVDYQDREEAKTIDHSVYLDFNAAIRDAQAGSWFEGSPDLNKRIIFDFANEPLTAANASFNGSFVEVTFKSADGNPQEVIGSDDYWNGWMGEPKSEYFSVTVGGTTYSGANEEVLAVDSNGGLILMLPGVDIPTAASVTVSYAAPAGDDLYEVLQNWRGQDVENFTIQASYNAPRVTQRSLSDATFGHRDDWSYLAEDGANIAPLGLAGATGTITAVNAGRVTLQTSDGFYALNPMYDPTAVSGYASYKWAREAIEIELSGLDIGNVQVGDQVPLSVIAPVSGSVSVHKVREGAQGSHTPDGSGANTAETFYFVERSIEAEGLSIYRVANAGFTITWGGADVYGSDYGDELFGGLGNDFIYAGAGDDYILAGAGNDYVDGGAGDDTVELFGRAADYSLVLQADNSVVLTYEGNDLHPLIADKVTLENVEYLRFVNEQDDGPDIVQSVPLLHHGVLIKNGDIVKASGNYEVSRNPAAWTTLSASVATQYGHEIIEGNNGRNDLYSTTGKSALFGYGDDDRLFITNSASAKTLAYGDGGWDRLILQDLDAPVRVYLDDREIISSAGQQIFYGDIDRIEGTKGQDTVTLRSTDGFYIGTSDRILFHGNYMEYQSYGGSDTISLPVGSSADNQSASNEFGINYEWLNELGNGGITVSYLNGVTAKVSYRDFDGTVGTDTLTNVQSYRGTDFADTYDLTNQDSKYWTYINVDGGDDRVIGSGDTAVAYGSHAYATEVGTLGITVDLTTKTLDTQGREMLVVDASNISSWNGVSFGTDTLIDVSRIYGSRYDDTFIGDELNNSFRGEEGNDTFIGGGDADTVSYRNATHQIIAKMADGVVSPYHYDGDLFRSEGVDTLREIEAIQGSQYDDIYDARGFGDVGAANIGYYGAWNRFEGRGGNDEVIGNGRTEVAYWNSSTGVRVDLVNGFSDANAYHDPNISDDTVVEWEYLDTLGYDRLSGVNNVSGSDFNDHFIGTNFEQGNYKFWEAGFGEFFQGRGGDDYIDGGTGGYNRAQYRRDSGAVQVDLGSGSAIQYLGESLSGQVVGRDTLKNIQEVHGTAYDDILIGSDAGGFDWFRGVENLESFAGGDGSDWIDGKGGINEVGFFFDAGAVDIDLNNAVLQSDGQIWIEVIDGFSNTDYLRNIQWLEGTDYADRFVGDSEDNNIDARRGDDYIDGGAGSDTAEYNQVTNGVFVDLPNGKAYENYQINGAASDPYAATATGEFVDTLVSIENVIGSNGNDYFIGDGENNTFDGLLGDDVFAGGGGTDTVILRGNQDEYTVTQVQENEYLIESADGESSLKAFDVEVLAFADTTVAIDQPSPRFSQSVNPETGFIEVKTGWNGSTLSADYTLFVGGATLEQATLSKQLVDASGWTAAYTDNGIAGASVQAKFTAVGSDVAAPYGGTGEEITFVLKPTGSLESVVVELNGISFSDAADTRVEYGDQSLAPVLVRTDVSVGPILAVSEGDTDTWYEIEVNLDAALSFKQELSWEIVGAGASAVSGDDFVGGALPTGTFMFDVGDTSKTIRFQIAGDNAVEKDESFELRLSGDSGLYLGNLSGLVGTIENDDKSSVSISGTSLLLPEGDTGERSTYTFDIELDQATFETQTIDWMVEFIEGEASTADFFGPLSGTVTFNAGDTSEQISITVEGDLDKEGREDFRIKLLNPSSEILVDPIDGVLDAQIKDDDGYDLGGQVYFWGAGSPSKKYLLDGVDIGLTAATGNAVNELYDSVLNLKNLKLNVESGNSTSELWTDFEDVSHIEFEVEMSVSTAFQSSLPSGWTVTSEWVAGVYSYEANWTGAGVQTADRLKLGSFTFDTPELGAEVSMNLLSASQSSAATGETRTNVSPISMDISYETQTTLSSTPGAGYSMSGLAEGGYQVMADKDFELYTI
ncbi:Calx-beta domain-containing protein, partial [Shewanella sp.]|uniref:Calx-beta domain-containing protein n=1 Tax=Shewanella sp. TaxID=50422 RepID=UPI004047DE30